MKKTLSLILAVLMIMATMPMALAADPIALTEDNVVEWPTASGSIYFGQKVSDGITISGGEVQYNGTIVPGKFAIVDIATLPTVTKNYMLYLNFIPEDTTTYKGFENVRSTECICEVKKTTPVMVDEINDPIIATEIEPGAKLSTSTLSGGMVKNPLNPEEPKALAGKWRWTKSTTIVNQNGYQQARMVLSGYEIIYKDVWVKVKGDDTMPVLPAEIKELPIIENLRYDPENTLKYSDYEFKGGKAVISGTDTEIEGAFSFTAKWINAAPQISHTAVEVTFTPTDSTKASSVTFEIPVTVNPAIPAWKDGEAVITVPYGTKIDSSFDWYVTNALDHSTDGLLRSWGYKTIDGAEITGDFVPAVGTHEVTANLNLNGTGSQNWQTDTMMTFTLVVEGKTLDCILKPIGSGGYQVINDSLAYNAAKPQGTFTVIGKLSDTVVSENTVKYGEIFKPAENVSGTYTYEIKYNPIENDPFIIADFTSEQNAVCSWKATIDEVEKTFVFGETISLSSDKADFYRWNITDTNGNPIDVVIVSGSLESASVAFTMPDCDIIITSEIKEAGDIGGDIDFGDIDGIDGILDFLRGIIEKIKSVFEKIIEFFQSIGDMS